MENMTETLRESFDKYLKLNDAIIGALMCNAKQNVKDAQVNLTSIAVDIVSELESRDVYPDYLRYKGDTFAIDYDIKSIRIVRSISMDDLETIYRHESQKVGV
jgi:hypothetical protein